MRCDHTLVCWGSLFTLLFGAGIGTDAHGQAGAPIDLSLRASGPAPAAFLVDQLSPAEFRRTIGRLASLGSRFWSEPGNTSAVEFLRARLESLGYTNVVLDPYTFEEQTRHNVYATKIGTARPNEMYIVSAHMDSFSTVDVAFAPGADDDGSGTALVLELARVFSKVTTEVSVRFILFNNEETGLDGSEAYVANHRDLQGTPDEPTWLGVIQHDMILFDRFANPDADVEYQTEHDFAGEAIVLAQFVAGAMARYGTMSAEVGDNMNNTDSRSFWDDAPAVSARENQRVAEIGDGSNPHWHKPSDVPGTYTDADYAFGFNIVRMTAGAVAELVGARPDCNQNDVPDGVDIAAGAPDTNGDGVPDECQECNGNGLLDPVEISQGSALDCNNNGVPDDCDVTLFSADCNGDSVPDECQPPVGTQPGATDPACCPASSAPVPDLIDDVFGVPRVNTKSRFLSFAAGDAGRAQAIRVTFADLPPPHDAWNGTTLWVAEPTDVSELPGTDGDAAPTFAASTLQCDMRFSTWSDFGTIHVFHAGIVPGGTYHLQAIDPNCSFDSQGSFSAPLVLSTSAWADIAGAFDAGAGRWTVSDGTVDVTTDVVAILDKFSSAATAPTKARADLVPQTLDFKISIIDVTSALDAFSGRRFPFPVADLPCGE